MQNMKVLDHAAIPELERLFLSREPISDATLLIAAHPDDETIGAGVLLSRMKNVRIVHVTDGSPANPADARAAGFSTREAYAEARQKETVDALVLAGIGEDAITNLHFTDQEVSFHLKELSLRILTLVAEIKPKIILTHAYEAGHPDHDGVAFACHAAHRMCSPELAFRVCEFTGYHAENGGMKTYEFLPDASHRVYVCRLSSEEREQKIAMLRKFTTQARTLQPFALPEFERFRVAPQYDFTRLPQEEKLFYENFQWGIDGATWRKLAAQTLREISHPSSRESNGTERRVLAGGG